jgi:hypothetical protein
LEVPASPEFLRLARVTAAGLAGRIGFNYDEVEDLRLAIDELCFGLTGPSPRPGTVQLRYVLDGDTLVVEGQGRFADNVAPIELTELSKVILSALVDEHRLGVGPDGPRFRMVKQHHDMPEPDGIRGPDDNRGPGHKREPGA